MFSNISGLYPLKYLWHLYHAPNPPGCDNKKYLQSSPDVPWGTILPSWKLLGPSLPSSPPPSLSSSLSSFRFLLTSPPERPPCPPCLTQHPTPIRSLLFPVLFYFSLLDLAPLASHCLCLFPFCLLHWTGGSLRAATLPSSLLCFSVEDSAQHTVGAQQCIWN